jgi:hypothetical protein
MGDPLDMSIRASVHAALLGLVAAAVISTAPPAAASGQPASPERIAGLVRDLGSEKFATREKATRQLIELGIVTRDALERATLGGDAEVRVRARAVLDIVSESDFQQRLREFSADYDGRQHRTLPGWQQFSGRFGASRLARELFVEMQQAEPEMLAALAAGAKGGAAALGERAHAILDGQSETNLSLGTLASFLFVGSAEGVAVDEQSAQLFPYILQLTFQRNNKSEFWPALLKKLIGNWIAKDANPQTANQNLMWAAQLELRPEALAVATRMLSSDTKQPNQLNLRLVAILVVGNFGDKSHVAVLEKLLGDASPSPARPDNLPATAQLQIRDIVLAELVQLTEQDLRQYGEVAEHPYGAMGFQTPTFAFANDEARQAAIKKWMEWRAKHPNS